MTVLAPVCWPNGPRRPFATSRLCPSFTSPSTSNRKCFSWGSPPKCTMCTAPITASRPSSPGTTRCLAASRRPFSTGTSVLSFVRLRIGGRRTLSRRIRCSYQPAIPPSLELVSLRSLGTPPMPLRSLVASEGLRVGRASGLTLTTPACFDSSATSGRICERRSGSKSGTAGSASDCRSLNASGLYDLPFCCVSMRPMTSSPGTHFSRLSL